MFRDLLLLFPMVVAAMNMQAAVKVEKTEYKGWKNCYRVTNGEVEMIVTGDLGPRIIRFGFVGGRPPLHEFGNIERSYTVPHTLQLTLNERTFRHNDGTPLDRSAAVRSCPAHTHPWLPVAPGAKIPCC